MFRWCKVFNTNVDKFVEKGGVGRVNFTFFNAVARFALNPGNAVSLGRRLRELRVQAISQTS
jgi:hypothetical protein